MREGGQGVVLEPPCMVAAAAANGGGDARPPCRLRNPVRQGADHHMGVFVSQEPMQGPMQGGPSCLLRACPGGSHSTTMH